MNKEDFQAGRIALRRFGTKDNKTMLWDEKNYFSPLNLVKKQDLPLCMFLKEIQANETRCKTSRVSQKNFVQNADRADL